MPALTTLWQILTIGYSATVDTVTITITTDFPCHLFMRWSLIPPRKHRAAVLRRGLWLMTDFYYCFDVFKDNEQEEAGDTTTHTFIKPDWPFCQTRYFYFIGSRDSLASPSESCIFEYHNKSTAPPPPIEFEKYWDDEVDRGAQNMKRKTAQTFSPQLDYTCSKITLHLSREALPGPAFLTLETTFPDGSPTGVVLANSEVPAIDIPAFPAHTAIDFTLSTPVDLSTDALYAIGFLDWSDTPWDYYWIYGYADLDPYPRGNRWWRTRPENDWTMYEDGDWHFITWGVAL